MARDFEWDEAKRSTNLARHGIDFVDAVRIFDGPILERTDDRFDYGETRIAAIGVVDGHEITVYFTVRGTTIRIISARKATRDERQAYDQAIG